MASQSTGGSLRDDIEPLVTAMGFDLIEMKHKELSQNYKVAMVVHRPEGVSVDDCASISHVVYPRLKTILRRDDISLEVASPGTDRQLKSVEEFTIFKGKGVRILREGEDTWEGGVIFDCRDGFLCLQRDEKYVKIGLSEIRKARLDSTQEVRT